MRAAAPMVSSSRRRDPSATPANIPPQKPAQNEANMLNQEDGGWIQVLRGKQSWMEKGNGEKMRKEDAKVFGAQPRPKPFKETKSTKASSSWRFAQGSTATPWNQICKMGRRLEETCTLEFFEPWRDKACQNFVHTDVPELNWMLKNGKNTLVGYVLGDKPFYLHLKACVGRLWKPTYSMEIHSREHGFFPL